MGSRLFMIQSSISWAEYEMLIRNQADNKDDEEDLPPLTPLPLAVSDQLMTRPPSCWREAMPMGSHAGEGIC